jgi:hypothetical protein
LGWYPDKIVFASAPETGLDQYGGARFAATD